jgi:hypothetical protein
MTIHFPRLRSSISAILFSLVAASGDARACMVFHKPDPGFWAEHATSIVDATVVAFDRQPLTKPGSSEESYQGSTTWVLTLNVHRTLRGSAAGTRLVATRFWNTTVVNETRVRGLLGEWREFALVEFDSGKSTVFAPTGEEFESLLESGLMSPHDGFHAWDRDGQPLAEIWEGFCTSLPVFDQGTFEN